MQRYLPWLLIWIRFLLTVPAVLFGVYGFTGSIYTVLLLLAAGTDYYDGVLARKYGTETALLRQADSIADAVFFVGVLGGIWFAYPEIYTQYALGIELVVGLEMLRYVYDLAKFRRGASYHAISAKIFGVSLLVASIAIMGFGIAFPFLPIALALGVISEMEGLLMSILLKEWTYNIRHVGIIIRLRNTQKNH